MIEALKVFHNKTLVGNVLNEVATQIHENYDEYVVARVRRGLMVGTKENPFGVFLSRAEDRLFLSVRLEILDRGDIVVPIDEEYIEVKNQDIASHVLSLVIANLIVEK